MPIKEKYIADLVEDQCYHIYNRTNNKELLFREEENYIFFMHRFNDFLSPYLEIFCWNFLPNHFHFLVRIRKRQEIKACLEKLQERTRRQELYLKDKVSCSDLIENAFRSFFISYAMSINKVYRRQGNFFQRPFKRIRICDDGQFRNTVIYIHLNSVKHKLGRNFEDYPWSSWKHILKKGKRNFLRDELIKRFVNLELFVQTHINVASFYENFASDIEA